MPTSPASSKRNFRMSNENVARYVAARIETFIDWSPDWGVACSVLEGELAPKTTAEAFLAIFEPSEDNPSGLIYIARPEYQKDLPKYRSKILKINPFEDGKVIIPAIGIRNKSFGEGVASVLAEENLPIMVVTFGKDAQNQKDVIKFYYPWGFELPLALNEFQVNLREIFAKQN